MYWGNLLRVREAIMCKLKYFLKSDQENARLVISTLSLGTYWLSWLTLKKLKLEFLLKGTIFVSLQLRQDFYNLHPWMKLNAFPFFFPSASKMANYVSKKWPSVCVSDIRPRMLPRQKQGVKPWFQIWPPALTRPFFASNTARKFRPSKFFSLR